MAKELEQQAPVNQETAAIIQQVIKALAASGAFGQAKSSAQLQLEELQAKKLKKEMDQQEENEENRRKAHAEGARSMEQRRLNELAKQAACNHMLELQGGPAIVCQRNHNRDYMFMCQLCQKEWLNGEVPPHLRIPMDRIGGPLF